MELNIPERPVGAQGQQKLGATPPKSSPTKLDSGRLIVGAVAYHPRVVTVWEGFVQYFKAGGLDVDYVLYSNYEGLVAALLAGRIDIAWNTNTAYVAVDTALGGQAILLGMRDVDAAYATVLLARRDDSIASPAELGGSTLALGSRDSGHAAILPLHFLETEAAPLQQIQLLRFDTDLGKHGDTGDSELRVVRAVATGEARAGAIGDATWTRFLAEGLPEAPGLRAFWRSPTYYHCCFTALPTVNRELSRRWLQLLLAMDYDDPKLRNYMDLEGVKRWLAGDKAGYSELKIAMRRQGYLP